MGSLQRTSLRLADGKTASRFEGKFEICSLVGTLGEGGLHLHVSLADNEGKMVGGHLLDGCRINTTAELVIGELGGLVFTRPFDEETVCREISNSCAPFLCWQKHKKPGPEQPPHPLSRVRAQGYGELSIAEKRAGSSPKGWWKGE